MLLQKNHLSTYFILLFVWILFSCKPSEKTTSNAQVEVTGAPIYAAVPVEKPEELEEAPPIWAAKKGPYRPEPTKVFDLLHTALDVSFDWEKEHVIGKAELTMKPWFYPQNEVVLDAKGFDIHAVSRDVMGDSAELSYKYDGEKLRIALDRTYQKGEALKIRIHYVAKPSELQKGGSDAITDDRGLYFINADGSNPNKPRQIWTQGETQASSCWFPTFDAPNIRTSQEIRITVDTAFQTLSNGKLLMTQINADGTRTDHWKQALPHAPYLFMLAVGEFAVIEDEDWQGKPIKYYVEPKYAPYAKAIFGKTPEMLSFFSEKFGHPYPWDKYSQIVVRDFVSGAMENTGAVVFMEDIQVDDRYLIDDNWDNIIAHEMAHHWFGNLVTCESWANLPLNEAFATYAEYLWLEHHVGKEEADLHWQEELDTYLYEAETKQEPLIRYFYTDREDMFDSHSYAKGSLILHMLRHYVGDDAFFASLQYYLEKNKFSDTEIHHLRIAFEEVTGNDMHWFFDQWFMEAGHPKINVAHTFDNDTLSIRVRQQQDAKYTPLYNMPIAVDIWVDGKKRQEEIRITKPLQEFLFVLDSKPDLVLFDPDHVIPCEIDYLKTTEEFIFQYKNVEHILQRLVALEELATDVEDPAIFQTIQSALSADFWKLREKALLAFEGYEGEHIDAIAKKVSEMALHDPHPMVRAEAMNTISTLGNSYTGIALAALKDSSYTVVSTALYAYANMGGADAEKYFEQFESVDDISIVATVADFYSYYGIEDKFEWFEQKLVSMEGLELQYLLNYFGTYLMQQSSDMQQAGIQHLKKIALKSGSFGSRTAAFRALFLLYDASGVPELLNRIKNQEADPQAIELYNQMLSSN